MADQPQDRETGGQEDGGRRLTRRDLLKSSAGAGAAGLVVGAAGGFGVGRATSGDGPAVAAGDGAATPGRPLRIVSPYEFAGPFAASGEEFKAGSELAIDEINALGGVNGHPLEWVDYDAGDVFDATAVRSAFTRIVETMEPDIIATAFAGAMGPDLDVSADAGVIYMNGNTREDWREIYQSDPERYWCVFQADTAETPYGTGFALFLDELIDSGQFEGDKTVAIIANDDPYGTQIANVFEEGIIERGWTVTERQTSSFGQVDWGPVLARLRSDPPTCVFSTNAAIADSASMIQQWVSSPLPSLLYQQYAPSEAEYLSLAGDAANGVIWSSVLSLQADDISNEFRRKFRERHGREPSWAYAGQGYDIIHLWAKAVALANDVDDTRKIAAIIERGRPEEEEPGIHPLSIHRGVVGATSFPSDHTVSSYPSEIGDPSRGHPHLIAQIRDGEHVQIYPEPYVDGAFEPPPWM